MNFEEYLKKFRERFDTMSFVVGGVLVFFALLLFRAVNKDTTNVHVYGTEQTTNERSGDKKTLPNPPHAEEHGKMRGVGELGTMRPETPE